MAAQYARNSRRSNAPNNNFLGSANARSNGIVNFNIGNLVNVNAGNSAGSRLKRAGNANQAPHVRVNSQGRFLPNNLTPAWLTRVQDPANKDCVQAAQRNGVRSQAFQTCFARHMRRFGISKPTTTSCGTNTLAPHQKRIYELAKVFASLEPTSDDRGHLAWTATGGGKTVIALAILLAYWDSPKKLYVVTTHENRDTNSPDKYYSNLQKFFPREYAAIHRRQPNKNKVFGPLDAHVTFLSFKQLSNMLGVGAGNVAAARYGGTKPWSGYGSVIVFDEAHGLVEDGGENGLRGVGDALRTLSLEHRRKVHLWALTATPGSGIPQWLKLLSMVRRANDPDFSTSAGTVETWLKTGQSMALQQWLGNHVDGLVSFTDIRANLLDHACVRQVNHPVPVDRWYYMCMLGVLQDRQQCFLHPPPENIEYKCDDIKRVGMFLERKEYKDLLPPEAIATLVKTKKLLPGNEWASNKLILLATFLAKKPGKHFVYVGSTKAAYKLTVALREWHGFRDVTDAAKGMNTKNRRVTWPANGKNFVHLGILPRRESTNQRNALRCAFDGTPTHNLHGDEVKLFICSGRAYEGTDLKGLRYVHLADPLPTALQERQAVGRGVRFCGHAWLLPRDRTVTIVRWYTTPPPADKRKGMTELAIRHKYRHGKELTNTQSNTRIRFKQLLQRIKQASDEWGNEGPESAMRKRALGDPGAVALSNFETLLSQRATGRPVSKFSDVFKIIPGKACP